MMATTHALVGATMGAGVAVVAPELGPAAVLAGFLGGLLPDLDLSATHRKTLHFPVYFSLALLPAVTGAFVRPEPVTVGAATCLAAAAVHSVMDAVGGGLELRPWRGTADRAVYSHFHGRWIAPRRWIPYDGAPADLALAAIAALPPVLLVDGAIDSLVAGALVVSIGYATVRKRLPDLAGQLVGSAPPGFVELLPDQVLEDEWL